MSCGIDPSIMRVLSFGRNEIRIPKQELQIYGLLDWKMYVNPKNCRFY